MSNSGDYIHSMPVSQMGNYQEYLKRMPSPLREVESTPVRQHMFGNPFKIDKRMMVDEADIDLVSSGSPHRLSTKRGTSEPLSPRSPNKRKPGPIPRDVMVRRPVSPTLAPPVLPVANMSLPPPLTPAIVNGELDDLDSLSSEENRTRSPSPPPLQPFDECLPILDQFSESAPILAYSPPNNSQSLGPPPLILMEDSSSVINWQNNHVFQENHIHSPSSPPTLRDNKNPNELPVSKSELTEIKRHNLNMRALAFKEVRRPGINYAPLFGHLEQLKGSVDVRAKILKDVINESLRFKRCKLANLLDEFLQSMQPAVKGNNGER